jgi:spore coat polysaccharide biosynthesis protein SpsF (cytidylyltransferase family)
VTVAIIQARTGSTRLPGKVLAPIAGRPMLLRVVDRARRAKTLGRVVVATSTAVSDDRVEALCAAEGVDCFRGSENDVLERYAGAARRFGGDPIVRITADCPLLDAAVVDRVVETYREGSYDYVANINPPSFPDGLDTEVFSADALRASESEARLASEREHVTLFIRNRPERFRIGNVVHGTDLSALRWTVDAPEDLEFVRRVYERLGEAPFALQDVLDLLAGDPALAGAAAPLGRDEGLRRSLAEDRVVR